MYNYRKIEERLDRLEAQMKYVLRTSYIECAIIYTMTVFNIFTSRTTNGILQKIFKYIQEAIPHRRSHMDYPFQHWKK